jgi:CheY-like chemotaxis protein
MASVRVLIVEDNLVDQAVLGRILKGSGISIRMSWAASAEEAEDALAEYEGFSLVLADVSLSGLRTGFDLWSHCQANYPALPFVMASGIDRATYDKLSTPGEIAPLFLTKPYRRKEIQQSLRSLLKKKSA